MQMKNLIFVFSIAAASVSTVFGAASKNLDYSSFKSCINGDINACPDFTKFYPDETSYKQHEESLKNCLGGNKDSCEKWHVGQPEGLKQYFKTLDEHVSTAKKEKFSIIGALRKGFGSLKEKLFGKKEKARRSVYQVLNRREDHVTAIQQMLGGVANGALNVAAGAVGIVGYLPIMLFVRLQCTVGHYQRDIEHLSPSQRPGFIADWRLCGEH